MNVPIFSKYAPWWVFFLIALQVLILSLFAKDGGLSPDSANYLRLAMHDGLMMPDVFSPTGEHYFAVWPTLYPLSIRFISWFSGVDVWWASKIANILFIGLGCLILQRIFGKNSHWYMLLFMSDSFIRINYMSWSEVPFSVALLGLAYGLYRFTETGHKTWLVVIISACVAAFLSRYIGLFTLLPLALVGLYQLRLRKYGNFILLAVSGVIVLALCSGYLWLNYTHVGSITGIERAPSAETHSALFSSLLLAQLKEEKLFIIVAAAYLLIIGAMRKFRGYTLGFPQYGDLKNAQPWPFFLLVGGCYWLSIVIMRWNFHFDNFDHRLLGPATLLFSFAALNLAFGFKGCETHIKRYIALLITVVLIYHIPIKASKGRLAYYPTIKEAQFKRYAPVKDNAIILFARLEMVYYHPNAQPAAPFPYSGNRANGKALLEMIMPGDTLESYTQSLCHTTSASAIYLDPAGGRSTLRAIAKHGEFSLDESFTSLIKSYPSHSLVLIKQC